MNKDTKKQEPYYYFIWTSSGPITKRSDEPIVWTSKGPR